MAQKLFLISVLLLMTNACASRPAMPDHDIVLLVTPMAVHEMDANTSVDVIEQAADGSLLIGAKVTMRIKSVLKGELPKETVGGPSRFEQGQEAVQNKDVLKLLTLDFTDPDEEIDRQWISVAVQDPGETFGISSWESPEKMVHRIYLKRMSDQPNSYLMVGSRPNKR